MAKTSLRSWMQNGKISHQFLLVFIPIISVILIALATYNYTAQKSILLADIENFSTQVVEANAAFIGAKLHEQITELQRIAESSKFQRMNWVEIKPRISQLNKSIEHLYSHLLILTPEGKTYETDSAEITNIELGTLTAKIFTDKLSSYIGKPFYSEQRKLWLIPIAVPILTDESILVGALAAMIPLEKLSEVAGKINFNGKGYGWIVGEDGFVLAHPNPEVVTKLNVLESKAVGFTNLDVIGAEMLSQKNGIGEIIRPDGVEEILVYGSIPNSPGWTLGVAILKTEIYGEITESLLVALFSFLAAILLLIGIMFVLVENKITKPIREIIDYVEQISEGKLYVTPNKVWNNELGNISAALQLMQENLKRIIGVVYQNANTIHSGSMEMNLNSQQVSQGANQQAVSLEEISSAMEETLVTIKQNTDHAIQTERISQMASANIQVVSSSMEKTLYSMNSIAKKINIINEFAEKTRMLAINASIEAARAGTAGRGFAVVAGEVRKLAESSQEAAQTIIELSEQMVSDASQSNSLLESVIPDIEKTAELVKEIMNGSNDQQIGAQQATSAIMQLNKVTQENAASSEELSANGEFFLILAQTMKDAVSFFKMDNKDEKQTPTSGENKAKQKIGNRNEVTVKAKETKVNPTQKGISLEMHDTTDDDFEHL